MLYSECQIRYYNNKKGRFLPAATNVAKVIFLHLFVILFTGGVSAAGGCGIPACTEADTPWSRHPPEQTPPRADTPPGADTPPRADTPPGKQSPAYGQRAAGSHPTGMHSCLNMFWYKYVFENKN